MDQRRGGERECKQRESGIDPPRAKPRKESGQEREKRDDQGKPKMVHPRRMLATGRRIDGQVNEVSGQDDKN